MFGNRYDLTIGLKAEIPKFLMGKDVQGQVQDQDVEFYSLY